MLLLKTLTTDAIAILLEIVDCGEKQIRQKHLNNNHGVASLTKGTNNRELAASSTVSANGDGPPIDAVLDNLLVAGLEALVSLFRVGLQVSPQSNNPFSEMLVISNPVERLRKLLSSNALPPRAVELGHQLLQDLIGPQ